MAMPVVSGPAWEETIRFRSASQSLDLFLGFALRITLWPPGIVIALHFLGVFVITNLIELFIDSVEEHSR